MYYHYHFVDFCLLKSIDKEKLGFSDRFTIYCSIHFQFINSILSVFPLAVLLLVQSIIADSFQFQRFRLRVKILGTFPSKVHEVDVLFIQITFPLDIFERLLTGWHPFLRMDANYFHVFKIQKIYVIFSNFWLFLFIA